MLRKKFISVDLDETLGYFRGITPPNVHSRQEVQISSAPILRPDLVAVLHELLNDGGRVAVSSGRRIYPLLVALEESNLIDLIDRPFSREDLGYSFRRGGKEYLAVVQHFNMAPYQARSDMIIFGDNEWIDAPRNPDGVVFVCQPDGHLTTARIWQYILQELLEKGMGDFNKGFNELFSMGQQAAQMPLPRDHYVRPISEARRYTLQQGKAELYLQMRSSKSLDIVTPTIVPILSR